MRSGPGTALSVLGAFLIAAGIAVAAYFVLIKDDDGSGKPEALSAAELRDFADGLDHDVYWLGPRQGTTAYEATDTGDGRVYIRYLTRDANAGNPQPRFITVGTYQFPDALAGVRALADKSGSTKRRVSGGGLAVMSPDRPTSVYVAFPGTDYQIEVYAPDPTKALDLAVSGDLVPVP